MKRFISVMAAALSFSILGGRLLAEPQASPSATGRRISAEGTSQNTAGATVPVQEPESPVKKPVIDEDGTYHFNVGGEMYTGRLLTDFSVGKVNTSTSYGSYEFADGVLSAYPGGGLADSYNNYVGEDLASADYSDVTYFGVRIINNQSGSVLFGLQGYYEGTSFFMGEEGEDILLAFDDGRIYSATGNISAGRWCATFPPIFRDICWCLPPGFIIIRI